MRRDEEHQTMERDMTIEGDFSFNQFSSPVSQHGNRKNDLKLLYFEDISHRLFKLKRGKKDKKALMIPSEYNLKKKFARMYYRKYISAGETLIPCKQNHNLNFFVKV